jgi:hypothetical protein
MDRAGDDRVENAENPSEPVEGLVRPRTPEERRAFVKQATLVLFVAWLVAGLLFLLFATPIRPD